VSTASKVADDTVAIVKKKAKIPKPINSAADDHLDYSHLYSSFFDIFVGH
jgi:hypothetical protein